LSDSCLAKERMMIVLLAKRSGDCEAHVITTSKSGASVIRVLPENFEAINASSFPMVEMNFFNFFSGDL
jgi:hypothetical protein